MTLMLKDLPRNYSNWRWAYYRVKRFLWWAVNRLPQYDPPPEVLQGGHNLSPRTWLAKDVTPDNDFDRLVDRLMEDLIKLRSVL